MCTTSSLGTMDSERCRRNRHLAKLKNTTTLRRLEADVEDGVYEALLDSMEAKAVFRNVRDQTKPLADNRLPLYLVEIRYRRIFAGYLTCFIWASYDEVHFEVREVLEKLPAHRCGSGLLSMKTGHANSTIKGDCGSVPQRAGR